MKTNQNSKYEGPFISDIVKTIFGRKLVLIIIWISVMILGILSLLLVVNPKIEKYEVEFSYNYAKLNEGLNYNDSSFNYHSLLTRANLERVKNAKSEYDKVNIEKILDKSYIKIEKELNDQNEFESFVMKSSVKAFPNKNVAKDFLSDLINLPIEDNINIVKSLSYDSNFNAVDNSYYFEMKLNYLNNQFKIIEEAYDNIIKNFGDVIIESKNVSDYRSIFKNYLNQNPIESLIAESSRNGYVKDFQENKDKILNDLIGKIYNYELNLNKLESLKTMLGSTTVEYTSIEEVRDLVFENEEIKFDINNFTQKLLANNITVNELKSFVPEIVNIYTDETLNGMVKDVSQAKLDNFSLKLEDMILKTKEFTEELNSLEEKIMTKELRVNYNDLSVITLKGGLNIAVIIIVSIIAGFACGAIVNVVLDYKKIFLAKDEKE